jgi:hypothetical protein
MPALAIKINPASKINLRLMVRRMKASNGKSSRTKLQKRPQIDALFYLQICKLSNVGIFSFHLKNHKVFIKKYSINT